MKKITKIFLIIFSLFTLILAQDHLLITEICVIPTAAELIEIYNPTDTEISLDGR
ncbi:MAG: hypothetical protein ISS81_05980 [Candidatus Marinimicrobia bacterium]|nr:hypothetical protein [Candidatus Neomarinimicrobiota bacterium]